MAPDAGKAKTTLIQTMTPKEKKEVVNRGKTYAPTESQKITAKFHQLEEHGNANLDPRGLLHASMAWPTSPTPPGRRLGTVAAPIERRGIGAVTSAMDVFNRLEAGASLPQELPSRPRPSRRSEGPRSSPPPGLGEARPTSVCYEGERRRPIAVGGIVTHPVQAPPVRRHAERRRVDGIDGGGDLGAPEAAARSDHPRDDRGGVHQVGQMYGPNVTWGDLAHGSCRAAAPLFHQLGRARRADAEVAGSLGL